VTNRGRLVLQFLGLCSASYGSTGGTSRTTKLQHSAAKPYTILATQSIPNTKTSYSDHSGRVPGPGTHDTPIMMTPRSTQDPEKAANNLEARRKARGRPQDYDEPRSDARPGFIAYARQQRKRTTQRRYRGGQRCSELDSIGEVQRQAFRSTRDRERTQSGIQATSTGPPSRERVSRSRTAVESHTENERVRATNNGGRSERSKATSTGVAPSASSGSPLCPRAGRP